MPRSSRWTTVPPTRGATGCDRYRTEVTTPRCRHRREAVGLGGRVEDGPRRTALGPGDPALRVDVDGTHPAEVDHQAVVADGEASGVVAAAANRDR